MRPVCESSAIVRANAECVLSQQCVFVRCISGMTVRLPAPFELNIRLRARQCAGIAALADGKRGHDVPARASTTNSLE